MKSIRKSLATLLVAGGLAGAYFAGSTLVKDVQFARAEQQVESTREQLANVEDLATVFRNVGKVVEPSVVNITVRKGPTAGGAHPNIPDDMLRRFFPDRDGDGEPDVPEGFEERFGEGFEQMGTGSGVIIETDGDTAYVVTNNHVAGGATELRITLSDGRVIENGKVVGTDAKTDLAVVKIEAERLISAKWGDSDELQKGDWIMAFGSPFGYIGSMTHGIVSALNRQAGILGNQGYESFIQVDAPINPGNSGGPLVNVKGEVVGINTAIASRNGGFQGIGFAIPSNQAKFVYSALKDKGKVVRGWLGVSISDVARDQDKARSFGFSGDKGVLVEQTFANTPATGKLRPGDIVTALDGKPVENVQQLRNTVAATPPGTELKMTIFRGGKNADVGVKIGEQPEDLMAVAGRAGGVAPEGGDAEPGEANIEALGITLGDVTDELAAQFNLGDNRDGALVTKVAPRSAAAREGLSEGELISKVGDVEVKSAKEAADAIRKQDLTKGVRFYVTGAEGSRFVFVKPPKS